MTDGNDIPPEYEEVGGNTPVPPRNEPSPGPIGSRFNLALYGGKSLSGEWNNRAKKSVSDDDDRGSEK